MADLAGLGPNAGLVDEMYRRWQESPGSLAPAWQEFFADYTPRGAAAPAPAVEVPAAAAAPEPAPAAVEPVAEPAKPLKGAAAPRGV